MRPRMERWEIGRATEPVPTVPTPKIANQQTLPIGIQQPTRKRHCPKPSSIPLLRTYVASLPMGLRLEIFSASSPTMNHCPRASSHAPNRTTSSPPSSLAASTKCDSPRLLLALSLLSHRCRLDFMHSPHMRNHLIPPREPIFAPTMARLPSRRVDIRARYQVPVVERVDVALQVRIAGETDLAGGASSVETGVLRWAVGSEDRSQRMVLSGVCEV